MKVKRETVATVCPAIRTRKVSKKIRVRRIAGVLNETQTEALQNMKRHRLSQVAG